MLVWSSRCFVRFSFFFNHLTVTALCHNFLYTIKGRDEPFPTTLYFIPYLIEGVGPCHVSPGYFALDENGEQASTLGEHWTRNDYGWSGSLYLAGAEIVIER
jgi:hypothetical protein